MSYKILKVSIKGFYNSKDMICCCHCYTTKETIPNRECYCFSHYFYEQEGQGGTTEEQEEQGQGQQVGEIPDVPFG
jgi:hypothetical protein